MEQTQLIIPRSQGPTIRQVFYEDGNHLLLPDTSSGIMTILGAVAFPIVNILEKIGPFEMRAFHDYKHPAGIIETLQKEIDIQAIKNSRVNQMNGILFLDTDRIGVHRNVRGSRISRELETATYHLVKYVPTKNVAFRTINLEELP